MDDVSEQIERFAGYLRLFEMDGRIKALLEGEAPEYDLDLQTLSTQALPPAPEPLSLMRSAAPDPVAPWHDALGVLVPSAKYFPPPPEPRWADLLPPELDPIEAPDVPVIMPNPGIDIQYAAIGSQLIHIRQINTLEDNDTVLANPDAGRPGWADVDTDARLAALKADAGLTEIPGELADLRDAVADPLAFPDALLAVLGDQKEAARLDAEKKAAEESGAEWTGEENWVTTLAVESEGTWVNGVLTDTAPERPDFGDRLKATDPNGAPVADTAPGDEVADEPEPEGRNGLERPGMEAELGGNLAWSVASILDLNDAGGTLVVMGDVHDVSVIWQTNILSDLDNAHLAGPADPLADGTNMLTNIARFQTDPSMIAPDLPSAIPLAHGWIVDVVEGNLVDFNMLLQHNIMRDGDLSVQHAETGFQRFVLGENESLAAADLTVLRDYYDVIFVGGDMIRANMIFQYNALIDDDAIRLMAGGADGTAEVLGGGNTLWNEALIQRIGTDDFTQVTDGARDFLGVLEDRESSLDHPPDLAVPAGGGAPLRVLYVEEDYWDVNVIAQTNEIHDADAALQFGVGEMSLSTGGNTAANVAQIVDFRGQGEVAMVGGEHYDDEMMIHTNILAEDQDVRVVDAQTLAGEVIAFLDPDLVTEAETDDQFGPIGANAGDDMMSGVMA